MARDSTPGFWAEKRNVCAVLPDAYLIARSAMMYLRDSVQGKVMSQVLVHRDLVAKIERIQRRKESRGGKGRVSEVEGFYDR